MEIDRQYIRHIAWDYLKSNNDTQMNNILGHVRSTIKQNNYHMGVVKIVYEEVFNLSNNGLIIFAKPNFECSGGIHDGFPQITVTEYGKKCFALDTFMPYDPDGYIQKVKAVIQGIDDITVKYLSESIHVFNRQAPVSATIVLGIASEQIMLLLIEAYATALQNNEKDNLLKKIKGKFIQTKYEEFKKSFDNHHNAVPPEIKQDIDTAIDSTFRFIKMLRNEQGHPTIVDADKDTVYAELQRFPHHARRMFGLIRWLRENKI